MCEGATMSQKVDLGKSSETRTYVHGYSVAEQQRLYDQARFLEALVFDGVQFGAGKILEVGCGVGAQTEILLKRFPDISVTAVDQSEAQLATANKRHERNIKDGRVNFSAMDASQMSFAGGSFEGAFVCWLLEHVPDPVSILKDVHRCMKPGAKVFCIEVQNASLQVAPSAPCTMRYWEALNKKQAETGDPYVGARLGNLLASAGFSDIALQYPVRHYDQRDRAALSSMVAYWTSLMLSAEDVLLAEGRVSKEDVAGLRRELAAVASSPEGLFFYTPVKAVAQK